MLNGSLAWRNFLFLALVWLLASASIACHHERKLAVHHGSAPSAACSASPTSVYQGSDDSVQIHVNGSSPRGAQLTYAFSASAGRLESSGPDSRWYSSGLAPGSYAVTAKIEDGRGGATSCSVDIEVLTRRGPPQADGHPIPLDGPPGGLQLHISAERSPIIVGENVTLSAVADNPRSSPLAYSWSASAGRIIGAGSRVQFDSAGLAPGTYVIMVSVKDAAGRESTSSVSLDIEGPPPAPPPPPARVKNHSPRPRAKPTSARPPLVGSAGSPNQVSAGNVAFKSEDTMELGNSYPVLVLVSRTVSKPELEKILEEQLQKARPDTEKKITDHGKMTSEQIKVTPKMRAHLSANADEFAISAVTPEDQDTNVESVTKWEWTVKPLKSGKDLKLDLTLSLVVDSQGIPHALETYHRFILVTVSFPRRVEDFVAGNWQWLWATLLVPVAGWLWRRSRQQSGSPGKHS